MNNKTKQNAKTPTTLFEMLKSGLIHRGSPVTALPFIGPHYAENIATACHGACTVGELLTMFHNKNVTAVQALVALCSRNLRAGQILNDRTVPECNNRVRRTLIDLLIIVKEHPDLIQPQCKVVPSKRRLEQMRDGECPPTLSETYKTRPCPYNLRSGPRLIRSLF